MGAIINIMELKEYGGYFGLELPRKKEIFSDIAEEDKLRVNCGRAALYYAVQGFKRVYMPYFNCINSVDPVLQANIEVSYYHLSDELLPLNVNPKDNETVVWINYYGNATAKTIQKVVDSFENLIIDNCQAFFSPPVMTKNVKNIYSVRKFLGTSDGGYLIGNGLNCIQPPKSFSSDSSLFLLKTIEYGTNTIYPESLKNEQRLSKNISGMSDLTKRILSSIDYDFIKNQRKLNLIRIHKNLGQLNEFKINLESETHMFYPLLIMKEGLREHLLKNKIYCPTLWRHVPEQCGYTDPETTFSKYMLLLPIDQRYDLNDMDNISEIVWQAYKLNLKGD